MKDIEIKNRKNELTFLPKILPVEFANIYKDKHEKSLSIESHLSNKNDIEKENIKNKHKLKDKLKSSEAMDKLDDINSISESRNEMAAAADFNISNKKTTFVRILLYLARKRIKAYGKSKIA